MSKFKQVLEALRLSHISFLTAPILRKYVDNLEKCYDEEIDTLQKELNVSRVANESLRKKLGEPNVY